MDTPFFFLIVIILFFDSLNFHTWKLRKRMHEAYFTRASDLSKDVKKSNVPIIEEILKLKQVKA